MDKQSIINAIEHTVGSTAYSSWYIGITDEPQRRKDEHGNPTKWRHWKADNEQIARDIERYFLKMGMTGDTGGGNNPSYVYIYQKN